MPGHGLRHTHPRHARLLARLLRGEFPPKKTQLWQGRVPPAQGTQPAGAAGGQGTGPPAPGCRSASSGLTGPTPSPFFKLVLRFDLQTTVREEPRGLTAHAPTPRPGLTPDHGGQPRPALSPSPAGWNILAHCVRPPVTRTPSFRPNERGRRLTIEEATRGQHRAGGASHTWSSPVAITGLHRELGPAPTGRAAGLSPAAGTRASSQPRPSARPSVGAVALERATVPQSAPGTRGRAPAAPGQDSGAGGRAAVRGSGLDPLRQWLCSPGRPPAPECPVNAGSSEASEPPAWQTRAAVA